MAALAVDAEWASVTAGDPHLQREFLDSEDIQRIVETIAAMPQSQRQALTVATVIAVPELDAATARARGSDVCGQGCTLCGGCAKGKHAVALDSRTGTLFVTLLAGVAPESAFARFAVSLSSEVTFASSRAQNPSATELKWAARVLACAAVPPCEPFGAAATTYGTTATLDTHTRLGRGGAQVFWQAVGRRLRVLDAGSAGGVRPTTGEVTPSPNGASLPAASTPVTAAPTPLAQMLCWRELVNDGGTLARGAVSRRRVNGLKSRYRLLVCVRATARWAIGAAVRARQLSRGDQSTDMAPAPFLPNLVVAEAGQLLKRQSKTRRTAWMVTTTVASGIGTGIAGGVVKGAMLGFSTGSVAAAAVGAAVGLVGGAVAGALGVGASRATTAARDARTRA